MIKTVYLEDKEKVNKLYNLMKSYIESQTNNDIIYELFNLLKWTRNKKYKNNKSNLLFLNYSPIGNYCEIGNYGEINNKIY